MTLLQLKITVFKDMLDDGFNDWLATTLRPETGGTCPVVMEYVQPKGSVTVRLGSVWQVHPSDMLLDQLRIAVGNDSVTLMHVS